MKAIPPFRLVAEPLNDAAAALPTFRWAGDNVGKRHKLGGAPDFIQSPETPLCSCAKPMTFYAQLDSINDDYCLADCGLIYVFVCFDCFETKAMLQSG
ncbi:MAG: hypothetical protein ISR49_03095 [Alphaproteobacteria bacterium]|nr:hypothetical protein [Alphaproteobacteria bacterium]